MHPVAACPTEEPEVPSPKRTWGIPLLPCPALGAEDSPAGAAGLLQGWRMRDAAPRRARGGSEHDTAVRGAERAESSDKCQNGAEVAPCF